MARPTLPNDGSNGAEFTFLTVRIERLSVLEFDRLYQQDLHHPSLKNQSIPRLCSLALVVAFRCSPVSITKQRRLPLNSAPLRALQLSDPQLLCAQFGDCDFALCVSDPQSSSSLTSIPDYMGHAALKLEEAISPIMAAYQGYQHNDGIQRGKMI